MNAQSLVFALLLSLSSGLVGVAVSTWYYRRHERRRQKLDTLTRLFGFRFDILGNDFSRALNEIFVVFHDSPKVIAALQTFHEITITGQGQLANDKLVALLKAMCNDVGIDSARVNDSFYLQPFNISERSTFAGYVTGKR